MIRKQRQKINKIIGRPERWLRTPHEERRLHKPRKNATYKNTPGSLLTRAFLWPGRPKNLPTHSRLGVHLMQQPHIVRRRAEAGGMTGRFFSNGRHHKARAPPKSSVLPPCTAPTQPGSLHVHWAEKSHGGENTHVLPKKKESNRRFLGAHRHGEEEEEGRALGEPYAHFVFDPSFFFFVKNMTVKLNYSAHAHTHTSTQLWTAQ